MSLESKCTIASRLAQFLRKNGHKVVNGSCKLSLTTSALCLLNTLFWDMLDDDGRYAPDITLPQDGVIVEDIQFLHSFIKKTSSLKLFHGTQTLRGGIDLSFFSSLTVLELRKIPAHLIIGLDLLSEQLRALICSRSIYLLKELFSTSMDGTTVVKYWDELRELNLACNYLENLDSSLKCLPNIELLDLSHNRLKNTEEIKVLKYLTFVNLSFNDLTHFPVFSIESCRSLTKLCLRNNNLEDLDGLDCLFNLENLDVAYNLLSEYHVLAPLENLKALKVLNLEGNPLFFHKRHTMLVAAYINANVLNRGLHLNGKSLAVPCSLTSATSDLGSSNNFNHQTSINTVVGNAESTVCVPENSHLSSSPSVISDIDENSVSSVTSQSKTDKMQLLHKKKKSKVRKTSTLKKGQKHREALITEPANQNEDVIKCTAVIETVPSHVRNRQILEERRMQRGETWLIPDLVPPSNAANSPKVPFNTPIVSPKVPFNTPVVHSPKIHENININLAVKLATSGLTPGTSCSPLNTIETLSTVKEMTAILDIGADQQPAEGSRRGSRDSDDIEILESNSDTGLNPSEQLSTEQDNLSDCDIYSTTVINNDAEEMISDEESEDSIFFVESREGLSTRALSVTIGPKYIREKDVVKGRYIEDLDLSSLIIVQSITKKEEEKVINEVHLEFDTIKPSKQKRIYVMENSESSKNLTKILQPFADAKTLKDVTLGALECLKCNSQFSKQAAHKILVKTKIPQHMTGVLSSSYDSKKEYFQECDACPNCKSHILVEMEGLPLPTVAMPSKPTNVLTSASKKSANQSPDVLSTGSASSGSLIANLFSSIRLSPILKKKSLPTAKSEPAADIINKQNSAVADESNEIFDSPPDASMRRNSSDITIISNPSQTSISLMPDPFVEPNLNTITEKDSQASLSPTISNDQMSSKAKMLPPSEKPHKDDAPAARETTHSHHNGEEHDFYSLTESLADENQLTLPTDILSSGSENYRSPRMSKSASFHSEENDDDEGTRLISMLGEKTVIMHDTFSQLDHRLKLHLEINVFGKEEELEGCLETSIVPLSTGVEFRGLFAISSKNLYIIKFLPLYKLSLQQNESIEKAIQILHTCPLHHLQQVKVILGNQGLTISCDTQNIYTLVIRDADICNSFSSLLSDLTQESRLDFGRVEFFSSTSETLKQIQSFVFSSKAECDDSCEVLLHLFAFWWNNTLNGKDTHHPVCIIITHEDIFITRVLYKKRDSCTDLKELFVYHYTVIEHQKISDLISLQIKQDFKSVEINFLNESSTENSDGVFWTIKTETKSSLFSFINSVKNPWEDVFKVPLPLSSAQGE